MKLATRRLIDASATLPAADRALINLWTQRGLDDAAMARMTGVDPATIAQRRERIVADLSTELGLPPADVAAALAAIAVSAAEARATGAGVANPAGETLAASSPESPLGNGGSTQVDRPSPEIEALAMAPAAASAGPPPTAVFQAQVEPKGVQPEPRPQPELAPTGAGTRRRPALWVSAALAGIAIIAIIAIAAASGSGSRHRTPSARAPASAPAPAAPAPPSSAPSGARRFGPLPGGVAGASGSVAVAPGSGGTQRLLVHVAGLPPAGSDHYAVWLYNSIIDSVPLGDLGPGGTGRFTLPAVVTRFASIDISRQTRGMRRPSGISVLRAANPLAGAPH